VPGEIFATENLPPVRGETVPAAGG
jgi:hypothetical protein